MVLPLWQPQQVDSSGLIIDLFDRDIIELNGARSTKKSDPDDRGPSSDGDANFSLPQVPRFVCTERAERDGPADLVKFFIVEPECRIGQVI